MPGAGDTWPCAAKSLLPARRRGVVAVSAVAVSPARRGCGESPAARRLRPRRQPHLERRPVDARNPALAPALPPLHGEVGVVLVAARPSYPRRRRLQGATRRA